MAPVFTSTVCTMFVGDLQGVYPNIALQIFDAFLIDGECVIFTLITKFITLKQEQMLEIEEDSEFI